MNNSDNKMGSQGVLINPSKLLEDIEQAMMANSLSPNKEFREDLCSCDTSVGFVCLYCIIHNTLSRCVQYICQAHKEHFQLSILLSEYKEKEREWDHEENN